jgi:phenylalanyl-tRNA synthetase beta chain
MSRVTPLPRFPAAERDLALVVSDPVPARDVERIVRRAGGPSLEGVTVFDVYHGTGLAEGEKSLGFRLRFRASDRTLTDEEVDAQIRQIVKAATDEVGARLRT